MSHEEWLALREIHIDAPAREAAAIRLAENEPVEIPLEDFGAGAAGALAILGGRELVIRVRKKKT